jgi:hypothetical protein
MRGGSGRRLSRLAVAVIAAAGLAAGLVIGSTVIGSTVTASTGTQATTAAQPTSTWDDAFVVPDSAPVADLLQGISCASRNSCVATGVNLNGPAPLAEIWNGSTWRSRPRAA